MNPDSRHSDPSLLSDIDADHDHSHVQQVDQYSYAEEEISTLFSSTSAHGSHHSSGSPGVAPDDPTRHSLAAVFSTPEHLRDHSRPARPQPRETRQSSTTSSSTGSTASSGANSVTAAAAAAVAAAAANANANANTIPGTGPESGSGSESGPGAAFDAGGPAIGGRYLIQRTVSTDPSNGDQSDPQTPSLGFVPTTVESQASFLASLEAVGIPTTTPSGEPIDLKKTCPFCGRNFSHPGSLGRHLDLKRGTRLHPAARVDVIRGNVKRRGDVVEIRDRRARRAKEYNAREDVKKRAKVRRRTKERSDRAKALARVNFLERLPVPTLPPHPSFAFMALYLIPPPKWPHDPPTQQTYELVASKVAEIESRWPGNGAGTENLQSKLDTAFAQWAIMDLEARQAVWVREQRHVSEMAIGPYLTLRDLGHRATWLDAEETRLIAIADAQAELDEPEEKQMDMELDMDMETSESTGGDSSSTSAKTRPENSIDQMLGD